MKNLAFLSLLIVFTFFGCKDEEQNTPFPSPSSSGEDIMAARVNGVEFICSGDQSLFTETGPNYLLNADSVLAIDGEANISGSGGIHIVVLKFDHAKTEFPIDDSSVINHATSFVDGTKFTPIPPFGNLKVSRWDEEVFAGTFNFIAKSEEGDTVIITDGMFDIPKK